MIIRKIWLTTFLYPATAAYLAAVTVILLISAGKLSVEGGIILLGLISVLIVSLAVWHNVQLVCNRVDGHSDNLEARIDQLTAALKNARIAMPDQPTRKVKSL